MKPPIPVSTLQEWIPHRPPMVWVDEVTRVTAGECECTVRLKADGLYMGKDGVRETSLIEWIAQSYAYSRAAQALCGVIPMMDKPKLAYLAAVTDADLNVVDAAGELKPGALVRVVIGEARELGPITLFEGSVLTETGKRIGHAKVKIFAQ